MLTTPTYSLRYPEAADANNVPQDIGHLAADVESTLGGFAQWQHGTYAARPAAGRTGRFYVVDSGANAGSIYVDTGSSWAQIARAEASNMAVTWQKQFSVTWDGTLSWEKIVYPSPGEALIDLKLVSTATQNNNYRSYLQGIPLPVSDTVLPARLRTAAGTFVHLSLAAVSGVWYLVPEGVSSAVGYTANITAGDTLWVQGLVRVA